MRTKPWLKTQTLAKKCWSLDYQSRAGLATSRSFTTSRRHSRWRLTLRLTSMIRISIRVRSRAKLGLARIVSMFTRSKRRFCANLWVITRNLEIFWFKEPMYVDATLLQRLRSLSSCSSSTKRVSMSSHTMTRKEHIASLPSSRN